MMHGFDPVDSLANSTIRYFIVLSISRLPRPYLGFEGEVAEALGRQWLSIERQHDYAILSAVRFMKDWPEKSILQTVASIEGGDFLDLGSPKLCNVAGEVAELLPTSAWPQEQK